MDNQSMGRDSSRGNLRQYDAESLSGYEQRSMPSEKGGMPNFNPNASNQQMARRAEERRKIQEEWGWQNEATVQLWEARAKARKGVKKKKELTADEKLRRFQQMK